MNFLLRFLCWRFYRFIFLIEVKPFVIWIYPPLLYYNVSLHDLLEIVVLFETSPRSSKSESGCKSYGRFRSGMTGSTGPGSGSIGGPVVPPRSTGRYRIRCVWRPGIPRECPVVLGKSPVV